MKYYYRYILSQNAFQRLRYTIFVFAVLFACLIIIPAFLDGEFIFYPLMKEGDVLDLFTPIFLIPLYWLLFQFCPNDQPTPKETLLFLFFAVLWVQGQGMHLVANSIGHLNQNLADTNEIKTLTYFYDETLSHYWWHCGLIGLSALLIYRQWQYPFRDRYSGLRWETAAGIIHGFNYFVDIIESGTTLIGVPFALIVVVFTCFWGRKQLHRQPILAFFFVAYLVACLFFLGWGIYHGGFPEFSELGII